MTRTGALCYNDRAATVVTAPLLGQSTKETDMPSIPRDHSERLAARFWPKVDQRGHDDCWPWLGAKRRRGYGRMWDGRAGAVREATHLALEFIDGVDVPSGMEVCHHCDCPECVNPAHLFVGTRGDNMRDCRNKGRARVPDNRGEGNARALLTEAAVRAIRRRHAAGGVTQRALAAEYGVHPATIAAVIQRRNWSDVL